MKPAPILLVCAMSIIGMHRAVARTPDTHLQCSGVDFKLQTERFGDSVLVQHLTADLESEDFLVVTSPVLLVHQTILGGPKMALNGSITQWACRRTRAATFLEVLYKCNDYMSDKGIGRYCARSGEWLSFIDLKGRSMDAGYRPDDPRYRSLEQKIGLQDAVAEEPRIEPLIPVR